MLWVEATGGNRAKLVSRAVDPVYMTTPQRYFVSVSPVLLSSSPFHIPPPHNLRDPNHIMAPLKEVTAVLAAQEYPDDIVEGEAYTTIERQKLLKLRQSRYGKVDRSQYPAIIRDVPNK